MLVNKEWVWLVVYVGLWLTRLLIIRLNYYITIVDEKSLYSCDDITSIKTSYKIKLIIWKIITTIFYLTEINNNKLKYKKCNND